MREKEDIGAQIAVIRKSLHLTQQELADKCGFTRCTISKIESGKYNASIGLITRLLEPIGYKLTVTEHKTTI